MIPTRRPRTVILTATTQADRWCLWESRLGYAVRSAPLVTVYQTVSLPYDPLRVRDGIVLQHPEYLGVVPAFAAAARATQALYPQAELYACLHDDCLLEDPNWLTQVEAYFDAHPRCSLLGFGGAWGLGEDDIRTADYRPDLLVRKGFMSNMRDAEAHGVRVTTPRQIAVLDGFSLIGRAGFMLHVWELLAKAGLVHHAYDAAFGALAAQYNLEVHLLPIPCHHLGGQTAVGDPGYHEWARGQAQYGDQGFWQQAHRIVYDRWGKALPVRVEQPEGWGGRA